MKEFGEVEHFRRFQEERKDPLWLKGLRASAFDSFQKLGFPTPENEEWKSISLPLDFGDHPVRLGRKIHVRLPMDPPVNRGPHETCFVGWKPGDDESVIPGDDMNGQVAPRLVFINGVYAPEFSLLEGLPAGVQLLPLSLTLREHPHPNPGSPKSTTFWGGGPLPSGERGENAGEILKSHLGKGVDFSIHPFAALNLAYFQEGAFLFIPAGVKVEFPICLLFLVDLNSSFQIPSPLMGEGQGEGDTLPLTPSHQGREDSKISHVPSGVDQGPRLFQPHNLIVAEEGGSVVIEERYFGEGAYFTNSVTELFLAKGAKIEHYKVQEESESAFHIATLQARQRERSLWVSYSISRGGRIARNEIISTLDGEESTSVLKGLFVATGQQVVDHHTMIDHAVPRCNSLELYRGILGGEATGVFRGKIRVRKDAQHTDARQTNKNLLLSPLARIDTQPQLEIHADDVKCAHGAAIGCLDENALFYLRSRGLQEEEAREMLTQAFVSDLLDGVGIIRLRMELESWFGKKNE